MPIKCIAIRNNGKACRQITDLVDGYCKYHQSSKFKVSKPDAVSPDERASSSNESTFFEENVDKMSNRFNKVSRWNNDQMGIPETVSDIDVSPVKVTKGVDMSCQTDWEPSDRTKGLIDRLRAVHKALLPTPLDLEEEITD